MGAVAAEDEVDGGEVPGHAHGSGLLAGGKVGGARVVVGDTVVAARRLHQVEHRLELADVAHVAIDTEQVFLGEVAFLKLFLDGLLVLHHGNRGEFQLVLLGTQRHIGINVK